MAKSATAAMKAEARNTEVSFEYGGQSYKVNPDLDLDVMEHLESGQVIKAVQALLGPEQYAKFKEGKPRMSNLNELMEVAFESLKIQLGESTA